MKIEKLIVGIMSGTSLNGIDAVLLRVRGSGAQTRMTQMLFREYRFPPGLTEMVLRNSHAETSNVEEITRLNVLFAKLYAEAVGKLVRAARLRLKDIDLIGCHGQTIHHLPTPKKLFGRTIRSTLQIGDPSVVATLTGVTTVGNFRAADMAVGGEGAPLVPYFDWLACRSRSRNRILLNIGGIANMTILPRGCRAEDVAAFDTGPGNMVIDSLMQQFFGKKFDKNGSTASRGMVILSLLREMKKHRYPKRKPPKSTGREEFGKDFVDKILRAAKGFAHEDIVATATEFTAFCVHDAFRRFVRQKKVDEIFVSGGGAKNKTIMKSLARHFEGTRVGVLDELGISGDAKEAMCFAILANETIAGNPANILGATGAHKQVVLGTISRPLS